MKFLIPAFLASSLLTAELPEQSLKTVSTDFYEKPFLIYVEEGEEIPLRFDLSGDVIAFQSHPEEAQIIALRPFYVHFDGAEFYFSLDKENWLPAMEFFTGKLFAGLGKNDEAFATVGLEVNVR